MEIENSELDYVESFSYLGSITTKTGGSKEDKKYVWFSHILTRRVKLKKYSTQSEVNLGCKKWNAAQPVICLFVKQCRIKRIFWPNVITNLRLWTQTNQLPMQLDRSTHDSNLT